VILKPTLTFLFFFFAITSFSQVKNADSVNKLSEVTVKGYYNKQSLLRSASAVTLIDSAQINNQNNASLVGIVNMATGVRMEERSPGSYRFSIRGSLLRSPFGIRNVKMYVDDFPLTDAGGNTYLNLLDVNGIRSLEIYKGPEASIYGANTGGAVLIASPQLTENKIALGASLGSYGLFKQHVSLTQTYKNYRFNFTQGFQKSDGYRENSALKRNFIQSTQQWDYSAKGQLNVLLFFSNLSYQTPGGLTAAQFALNPAMARPATPTLPGAVAQQAAIYNKTIYGGISNSYRFSERLKHVIAVFGSYTDFKNPFITNYEKRYENNIGLRTFLDYAITQTDFSWNMQLGVEAASAGSKINNFNNNGGEATALQAKDDLTANQTLGFLRVNFDINQRLLIELGASANLYNYHYQSYFPVAIGEKKKKFSNQVMPKIAASYLFIPTLSVRATVSKGYSPPTIAEVRSSDNQINSSLHPEYGWNYEGGLRFKTIDNKFYANINAFSFHLKDAIVRRLNQNDTEFFINAGGTKQRGVEIEAVGKLVSNLQLRGGYTFSKFKFQNGNKLTGVPDHSLVASAALTFPKNIFLFAQHTYTSSIPLNDANSVLAKSYHLSELKAGFRDLMIRKTKLEIFTGVNNLFNKTYSLGNDLNAANGRYFNPAARINCYFGFGLIL
jgi:iron complex outermembrane receptor protein